MVDSEVTDEQGFLPPREGERIPRKILPPLEPAANLKEGLFARGAAVWKVALDDVNRFGPHAMIFLLVILAALTGALLKLLSIIS
ncbi:MAG TPA: hypothetical protein QF646_07000 [Candidatus Poseidoniales archaeon]|nr:hypothetical protein [Candidatus Poseidoniales archaeon]